MTEAESNDVSVLHAIRNDWAEAEGTGDVELLEHLLANDAVIMPPGPPVLEGKAACMDFIKRTVSDLAKDFDRKITFESHEIEINGAWAVDRGVFTQRLVRRETGEEVQENGKYFWLYKRHASSWKLARVVGSIDWPEGNEAEAASTPNQAFRAQQNSKSEASPDCRG